MDDIEDEISKIQQKSVKSKSLDASFGKVKMHGNQMFMWIIAGFQKGFR